MKIKQMILAVFASLMVSESHACTMGYLSPEDPKSELYGQQIGRLLDEVNAPGSTCFEKVELKVAAYYANRIPEDKLVPAFDFYLAHLGVMEGENPVLGFKYGGQNPSSFVLQALAKLSVEDYQFYFDCATQVMGRKIWGEDRRVDSWNLARAFYEASLSEKDSVAILLGQLSELKKNVDLKGEDAAVFAELAWAHREKHPGFADFLKAVFKNGGVTDVDIDTVAKATSKAVYWSPNIQPDEAGFVLVRAHIEQIHYDEWEQEHGSHF